VNKKTKSSTERGAWNALAAHYQNVRELHLRKLFADDATRGKRMTDRCGRFILDYSKNRVTDETLKLLVQLAMSRDLRERIDAMFRGDKINITENRAVLHVACGHRKGHRSLSMARTLSRKSTPFSTRWPTSPTA
jgi:Glucose-6-phosphate isomerase